MAFRIQVYSYSCTNPTQSSIPSCQKGFLQGRSGHPGSACFVAPFSPHLFPKGHAYLTSKLVTTPLLKARGLQNRLELDTHSQQRLHTTEGEVNSGALLAILLTQDKRNRWWLEEDKMSRKSFHKMKFMCMFVHVYKGLSHHLPTYTTFF